MPNANADKGAKFERDIAGYLRLAGLAAAERRVVTGWRRTDRSSPDLGDIKDLPGLCIQAKNVVESYPRGLSGKALVDVMAETEAQREALGAAIGLLVEKRLGRADPGLSWAHLPANVYLGLVGGLDPYSDALAELTYPIRTELHNITEALVRFSMMCDTEGLAA
jgi:hypothetical protein